MASVSGWLTEKLACLLLPRQECEVVLGDLVERGESDLRRLFDVLGLLVYRQAQPWRNWRSWVWGAALPVGGSFMLMGLSVSVALSWLEVIGREALPVMISNEPAPLTNLIGHSLMLLGCAWSSGFVVAATSSRTLRTSLVLCCLPCCFCLARFHIESLSPLCLLLFLIPALFGGLHGLRKRRLPFHLAVTIAVCTTIAAFIPWTAGAGRWVPATWLQATTTLPTWYLLAGCRPSNFRKPRG